MDEIAIDSRKIHKFLKITEGYEKWIREKIEILSLKKGKDYNIVKNGDKQDYVFKIDAAKRLCESEGSNKGKVLKKYYTKVEEKYNEIIEIYKKKLTSISPELDYVSNLLEEEARKQDQASK